MADLASGKGRDLRLDFFRGIALLFIFVDHIPRNVASWITVRNFGFSDASEIFVFISGYTAFVAYSGTYLRGGFRFAAARVLRRCWQLYIAHIFLFVVFTAQIAYTAKIFQNPMFSEEMNVVSFLEEPHVVLIEALLLKFRPANLDILPLYIVLLLAFPIVLLGLVRRPHATLGVSAALYAMTRAFEWNLPNYPPGGGWFFNPFAWQLLFVLGGFCGRWHGQRTPVEPYRRLIVPVAGAYLAFALFVVMTWHIPALGRYLPNWLAHLLYPIDKTNLDPLRFFHFLALAYVTAHFVKPDSAFLAWPAARPVLYCGRQGLQVFCVGTFLSFTGFFVLTEINGSLAAQLLVSAGGIALLIGLAYTLTWYQAMESAAWRNAMPAGRQTGDPR